MKPGKLYIKIFISFVLVLIITEILIFGLFLVAVGRTFRDRFERYTSAQALIMRELVEDKIRSEPETPPHENQSLKNLIMRLGETSGEEVWLEDAEGTPLLKSFTYDIPNDVQRIFRTQAKDYGSFKMYREFKKQHIFFISIPIEIRKGEIGSLCMFLKKIKTEHPAKPFALGLLGIGVVIAILIIPVSRTITKPIKLLNHSANQIAEGDLSQRVKVKSKNEIGELGRSFNHMADKLEQMIQGTKELTANISHELRSPLARIRVAEELLRERWEKGDYGDFNRLLDDIRDDIGELDRLIGSILVLSKLDIKEAHTKREPFNPADVIKDLLARLQPAISSRGLKVNTDVSFDSSILGDEDSFRTALTNVLDNAVKFTPDHGQIRVKTHVEHDCLKINVTNSFAPLSEDDLARIFQPFYRAEASPASGSGLGLAITKKIIEKHGGSISAVNSPQGLNVRISLPMGAPKAEI